MSAPSTTATNQTGSLRMLDVLRHGLRKSRRVDVAVSFTRFSGLSLLWDDLNRFVDRGGAIRFLTSTYLCVTQPEVLQVLVDTLSRDRVRVFDTDLPGFHAKVFLFGDGGETASELPTSCWVGSSNLTKGGLTTNFELNARIADPATLAALAADFRVAWEHPAAAVPDEDFIAAYAAKVAARGAPPPSTPLQGEQPGVAETPRTYAGAPAADGPTPNEAQSEAMQRLAELRSNGERRAAVIAAPGTGKTFLAAFDARAAGARSVLFVSHRLEHLRQAARTFARVMPERTGSLLDGGSRAQATDLVFGSIQSVSRRPEVMARRWDYIVIDEFHHASAPSYRALIEAAGAAFLLGLTATPERRDGHDVLRLCDYNVAYELRLPEAIRRRWLVAFHYFAVADETVDYAAIPWRSGAFDPSGLEAALQVEERADLALRYAREKGFDGRRRATVGFCAGRLHAAFMARAFNARGQVATCVTGETPVDLREDIYGDFADPSHPLEWLFVADVLNEGVDIPAINSILFLRPTDSATVFIQQLGRGLRLHDDCEVLTVVDLVGHHKKAWLSFEALNDPAAIPGPTTVQGLTVAITPPIGCEIVLDDVTQAILAKVAQVASKGRKRCEEVYEEMRRETGSPPYPVDFVGAQTAVAPSDFRAAFGDWIGCRVAMDDAEPWERSLDAGHPLRRLLASCERDWQAQRVYAYAALWGVVSEPAEPARGFAGFFERFPRWRVEYREDALPNGLATMAKKVGDVWDGEAEALASQVFAVVDAARVLQEVERRLQYQLEGDYRTRHGGVLRRPSDLVLWSRYRRPEILNHFGRQFDPARHNAGVITFSEPEFSDEICIITKLDTSGANAQFQYDNGFVDASTFKWQSQNRNAPTSEPGVRLVTPGAARIHLFVQERSHKSAVYCGTVTPLRHEGANPIDVWFNLSAPLPPAVQAALGVEL